MLALVVRRFSPKNCCSVPVFCNILTKMCDQATLVSTQSIADYLAQLLKDRKQLAAFPNVFLHVERLIDEGKMKILDF